MDSRRHNFKDLTGKRFGRLLVLSLNGRNPNFGGLIWKCKCDCGKVVNVLGNSLRNGLTKSCGCYRVERRKEMAKHGHNRITGKSLTYKTWDKMMSRCHNPNCKEYKYYGAIGIHVCERWHDFNNFLIDMGERTCKGLSIDRIDITKGYCKENCRWADRYTQANNTRRNVHVLYNERYYTVAELARLYNIEYDVLYSRIFKYKWTVKEAVEKPVEKRNK